MTEASPKHDQKVRSLIDDPNLSAFKKYRLLAVGSLSIWAFLKYEFLTFWFGWVPGAAGYFLRQKFYRYLFRDMGRGTTIGRNVTLRGVSRISLGRGVMIDDNVVLDARGAEASIELGDGVLIARNSIVRSRGQAIRIGEGTDIGSNCIVSTDSELVIGREVLIAAYAYVCAGGNHRHDDPSIPILRQGFDRQGGVRIGDGCWLGSHCMIMDGSELGEGCIIGSHAVVKGEIPALAIAVGTPARIMRQRGE